jgi:hypothetical protein
LVFICLLAQGIVAKRFASMNDRLLVSEMNQKEVNASDIHSQKTAEPDASSALKEALVKCESLKTLGLHPYGLFLATTIVQLDKYWNGTANQDATQCIDACGTRYREKPDSECCGKYGLGLISPRMLVALGAGNEMALPDMTVKAKDPCPADSGSVDSTGKKLEVPFAVVRSLSGNVNAYSKLKMMNILGHKSLVEAMQGNKGALAHIAWAAANCGADVASSCGWDPVTKQLKAHWAALGDPNKFLDHIFEEPVFSKVKKLATAWASLKDTEELKPLLKTDELKVSDVLSGLLNLSVLDYQVQ